MYNPIIVYLLALYKCVILVLSLLIDDRDKCQSKHTVCPESDVDKLQK